MQKGVLLFEPALAFRNGYQAGRLYRNFMSEYNLHSISHPGPKFT